MVFWNECRQLAEFVKEGIKTATTSALCFYELEGEALPKVGEYSIILDSKEHAVCVIRTTRVYVTSFNQVCEEHVFKEGEGNRTLEYWRSVHERFFAEELKSAGQPFDEKIQVVCEEFVVV